MCLRVSFKKKNMKKIIVSASLKSLKKGVWSGFITGSQRYGSAPKCHGSPTLTKIVWTYGSVSYVGPHISIVLGVVSTPTWRAGGAQRRVWEEAEPLYLPGEPQVTLLLIPAMAVDVECATLAVIDEIRVMYKTVPLHLVIIWWIPKGVPGTGTVTAAEHCSGEQLLFLWMSTCWKLRVIKQCFGFRSKKENSTRYKKIW